MSVGSLFAGIGGFDLAARWMGWTTKWVSEIDPYASAVLKKHFPVPNHGDITRIKGTDVEHVDLLCGGFPCQDISLAGRGAGIKEGTRSGLWSHYARLIEEIQPRYIVAENVSALRSRGLDIVLKDLMALGYDAEWHCVPASSVGAPHRRDRCWIVGYSSYRRCSGESRWGTGPLLTHGHFQLQEGRFGSSTDTGQEGVLSGGYPEGWWDIEPNVGRVAHGVPNRVDCIRCLGNAVVPHIPYKIFQGIQRFESALAA